MSLSSKNFSKKDIISTNEGRVHLATKINITSFVGIDVLNIFYLTTFSKKTIFFKI